MKKFFTLASMVLTITGYSQALNTRNITVLRVGDGTATLNTSTAPISLLDFAPTGANQLTPIKTVNIGSTVAGSRVTVAGTNNYEGQLSLSSDGRYLSFIGYDTSAGLPNTSTGISNIAVGAGGSGYTSTPTITITGGGGTGATGGVQLTGGVVTNIYISTSGAGYTSDPTITFTGGGGTGAAAGAISRVPFWQGFTNKKVVARVNSAGIVDYSTNFINSSNTATGAVKNAVSIDGSAFWVNTNKIEYVTFGQTTAATQVVAAGPRSINIFQNQLYYNNGFNNIFYTANPLPTASTTTGTVAVPLSSGSSVEEFAFLDLNPSIGWNGTPYDVVYVASLYSGLEKYYYDGTNWVPVNSQFLPSTGALNNAFGGGAISAITATVNSLGQPVIYALSGNSANNNNLLAITDGSGGYNGTMTTANTTMVTLATAGANYGFRGVAFAPSLFTLPINLSSFSGSLINNKSSLKWLTSSELNAKEFVVERSTNGNDFLAIAHVDAKNSNISNNYSYEDANVLRGINYYRLKLIDKDGSFSYSSIVVIKLDDLKMFSLNVFPNPVVNNLTISHAQAEEGALIQILALNGKTVAQYSVAKDAVQTSVSASQLLAGQYFVNFINKGKSVTISFFK